MQHYYYLRRFCLILLLTFTSGIVSWAQNLTFEIVSYDCNSGVLQYKFNSNDGSPVSVTLPGIFGGTLNPNTVATYTFPSDGRVGRTVNGSASQSGNQISVNFTNGCNMNTNPTNPTTPTTPTNPPTGSCVVSNPAGSFDHADCNGLSGWAFDNADLGKTLTIDIYVDGNKVGSVSANGDRPDVASYFGNSDARYHGFTYAFPSNASWKNGQNHNITVRICGVNNDLGGAKPVNCNGSTTPVVDPPAPSGYTYENVFNQGARIASVASDCGYYVPVPDGFIRIKSRATDPYNFSYEYNANNNPFYGEYLRNFNTYYGTDQTHASQYVANSPFFDYRSIDYFDRDGQTASEQYSAENGWLLAFKDFGTPNYYADGTSRGPLTPFFALYNKYTGVLRVFLLNAPNTFKRNTALITLKQYKLDNNAPMAPSALFSYATTNQDYSYYDNYEGKQVDCLPFQLSAIAQVKSFGWVHADFKLTGYQRNLSNTTLAVSIYDYDQATSLGDLDASLQAHGTFAGEIAASSQGTLSTVSGLFKGVSEAANSVAELNDIGGAASFFSSLLAIGSTATPLGLIANGLSLVDNVIGLFQSNDPQKFSGTVQLSGKVEGKITGQVNTPGSFKAQYVLALTDDVGAESIPGVHDRVDKNIPWGVYSLYRPNFKLTCNSNPTGDQYGSYRKQVFLEVPINVFTNPNIGMTLIKKELAFINVDRQNNTAYNINEFTDVNNGGTFLRVIDKTEGSTQVDPNPPAQIIQIPEAFILRLTFQTNTGKTVTILKTYYIPAQISDKMVRAAYNENISTCSVPSGRLASQELSEKESLTVYPNPFKNSQTIEYTASKAGQVSINVLDLSGRSVFSNTYSVEPGQQRITLDALNKNGSELPVGLYFLEINLPQENGVKRIVKRILKQ